MWTSLDVQHCRKTLNIDEALFARLLGVSTRTVVRWETGVAQPTGASAAVLTAIRESLRARPTNATTLTQFIVRAADVGGLGGFIVRLLDMVPGPPPPTVRAGTLTKRPQKSKREASTRGRARRGGVGRTALTGAGPGTTR